MCQDPNLLISLSSFFWSIINMFIIQMIDANPIRTFIYQNNFNDLQLICSHFPWFRCEDLNFKF